MSPHLPSVLVIDENAVRAAIIETGLREAGHHNVTVIHDVAGIAARIAALDGLRRERVKPILDLAISRFNAYSRLERELEDARNALQSRKLIDQAKRLLMRSRGMSEEAAYALLRRTAMHQNRKMAEVAHSLVLAADLLGQGGGDGRED